MQPDGGGASFFSGAWISNNLDSVLSQFSIREEMFGSVLLTTRLDFIKSDRRKSMSTDLSFQLVMFYRLKGGLTRFS